MTASVVTTVAFQGLPGAYSQIACASVFPTAVALPCASFEDAFAAIADGRADYGMIPIDNSVAGRVADIHHLLPGSGLHIIGEHFQAIHHHLLALPGVALGDITEVRSHVHAINQCKVFTRAHGIRPVVVADTAGAARDLAASGDRHAAAIASALAGDIYGLVSLAANIEDADHNTTRFIIMAREAVIADAAVADVVTAFTFKVRNVPAALYKALGGFATSGINMTKLESYMVDGAFVATEFFAEVEGRPEDKALALALEELAFYSREVNIMGVFPAHPFRFSARYGVGAAQ